MAQKENLSPIPLMELNWSFARTEILRAALELDLFTQIDNGKHTVREISSALGTEERGVRILLNALAGLKLVDKAGDRYSLPESSRAYLSRNSPACLAGALRNIDMVMPAWAHLAEVVRSGKPFRRVESPAEHGEFFAKLVPGLFVSHRPAAEHAATRIVGTRRGLRVLDIGAGSGVWGIHFAKQDPEAKVTIVDFPQVIEVAKKFVRQHEMEDRFDYLPGDFDEVEFGENQYDVVILGQVCHGVGERNTRRLLHRVRRALKPNGQLLIAEFLADEERKQAAFPLIFAINMLLNTEEGDTFTRSEMVCWLEEAGFGPIEFVEAPTASPLIVATAAARSGERVT